MDIFASNFKIFFNTILINERLKPLDMHKISGLTYDTVYDYKSGRSGPSAINLVKLINTFPQYTCYLLDMEPNKALLQQIIPKD